MLSIFLLLLISAGFLLLMAMPCEDILIIQFKAELFACFTSGFIDLILTIHLHVLINHLLIFIFFRSSLTLLTFITHYLYFVYYFLQFFLSTKLFLICLWLIIFCIHFICLFNDTLCVFEFIVKNGDHARNAHIALKGQRWGCIA